MSRIQELQARHNEVIKEISDLISEAIELGEDISILSDVEKTLKKTCMTKMQQELARVVSDESTIHLI